MSGCANAPEYYVIHTVPSLLCATCCVGLAIVLCWTGHCVVLDWQLCDPQIVFLFDFVFVAEFSSDVS